MREHRRAQDQAPETEHNAETKRFVGFDGTIEVPDSEPSFDEDLTRDTAPSIDVFGSQAQDELDRASLTDLRPTEITRTLVADRKTLPSATFQQTTSGKTSRPPQTISTRPHQPELSWDNEDPTDRPGPEENDENPSLWGRVQRFVKNLGKAQSSAPPTAPQAPPPLDSREKPSLKALLELAWSLDDGEIEDLAAHLDQILALRRLGPDAYAEARILSALQQQGPLTLSSLRQSLQEIPKQSFDDALLRLDERQRISLGPADEITLQAGPHNQNKAAS